MTVRLRHPDLPDDQTIDVAESAVPVHRSAGWVVVEDPAPDAPAELPAVEAKTATEAEAPELPAARKRRRTTEGE